MKHKYLILDTEGKKDCVYDIGIVVCDNQGTRYKMKGWLCEESLAILPNTAYYNEQKEKYKKLKRTTTSFKNIIKEIKQIIKYYKIKAIYAYNVGHDITVMNNTSEKLLGKPMFTTDELGVKFGDLWNMTVSTICLKKTFIDFCMKNQYFTDKGFLKTDTETVLKFLYNDKKRKTPHTALEDAIEETLIFERVHDTGRKFNDDLISFCSVVTQKLNKELIMKYEEQYVETQKRKIAERTKKMIRTKKRKKKEREALKKEIEEQTK